MSFKRLAEVATFPSSRNRIGEVSLVSTECNVCGATAVCLYIDGSEDEYGGGAICQRCTAAVFQRAVALDNELEISPPVSVDKHGYFHREPELARVVERGEAESTVGFFGEYRQPQDTIAPVIGTASTDRCSACGDMVAYCLCKGR